MLFLNGGKNPFFGQWPNRYAVELRKTARKAKLANRVHVPVDMQRSFWDEWQAAEDPCPSRENGLPHYAPSIERRRRCATCYHCHRLVFHR